MTAAASSARQAEQTLQKRQHWAMKLFPKGTRIGSSCASLLSPPSSSTAVKTWTLLADSEERIQAFKAKCLRKLLRISYLERKTNNWVLSEINSRACSQESLLVTVKRRKLAWFRHVTCHDSLSKTKPLQNQSSGQLGGWVMPW